MKITLSKNKLKEFYLSGLLIVSHLLSCIPILDGQGSIFDLFLPLIFPIFILIKNFQKKFNLLLIIIFLFFGFCIFLQNSDFLNSIAWFIRLSLPFSFIYLFYNTRNNPKNREELNFISKILFNFQVYFIILTILSIALFFGFLGERYYSIGFPFYANGSDRHVFGPTLAYLTIINFHSLFSLRTPFQEKYFNFIIIGNVFTFLVSITNGSRASIIVYVFYLFFILCKFLIQKINILSRYLYLSFPKNMIIPLAKFLFGIIFLIIFALIFLNSQNNTFAYEYFVWLIRRSFLFSFDLTNDISRYAMVSQIINVATNPGDFLFPTNFTNVLDSGFLLFTYNFGLIGFSLFSFLWIFSFKEINLNKISLFIVSSSYLYFCFNAPHIMIPRFWLIIFLPILLNI